MLTRTERVDRVARWAKRIAWGFTASALGGHASHTIAGLWGTSTSPTPRQVVVIVLLAVAAGALGGVLLVGRGWQGALLAAIIGSVVWAAGFSEAIPKTTAVCGGDAIGGCDHVFDIWVAFFSLLAFLPFAVGLFSTTALWWLVRPTTRHANKGAGEVAALSLAASPPPTEDQIAWAQYISGDDETQG